MTERMFGYCIRELRHRSKHHNDSTSGAIHVFPASVYKSDSAVSSKVKLALRKAVGPLEDVPEQRKDWHPGSDGKVLDLVHPSLFPLVYGHSKVIALGDKETTLDDCIRRCGEGEVLPSPNAEEFEAGLKKVLGWRYSKGSSKVYSQKFQWLPCEVDILGDRPRSASPFASPPGIS
jgi:hypothetical protein